MDFFFDKLFGPILVVLVCFFLIWTFYTGGKMDQQIDYCLQNGGIPVEGVGNSYVCLEKSALKYLPGK